MYEDEILYGWNKTTYPWTSFRISNFNLHIICKQKVYSEARTRLGSAQ